MGTKHRWITRVQEQVRIYSIEPVDDFMYEESIVTLDPRRSDGVFMPLQIVWWEHRANNR